MSGEWIKRVNLRNVRKLAAMVMKCGKNKVWMDPAEQEQLASGNTPVKIRQMVKDGLLVQRPDVIHSRGRARQYKLEKAKGRHRGLGKRSGTKNARLPQRIIWMQRIRSLRRVLKELRASGRIDRTAHHLLYAKAKGNSFKSKRLLLEYIAAEELKRKREEVLLTQMKEEGVHA